MKTLFILLIISSYLEAIITITPMEIGKKPGWSGTIKGALQTKRGNTDKDEYSLGVKVQYDNNSSYLIFTDVIGVYGEASGERNTNKTYFHTRYIHKFYENLDYELFIQSETNEFTSVEKRRLGGGGLRYHYLHSDYGDIFIGLGAYWESITYTTQIDPDERNSRINSYVAYVKDFSKEIKFTYVGYYQPRVDKLKDYITSSAIEFKMKIHKEFSLKIIVYYDVDSTPAIGRETTDFTQLTAFSYEF